MSEAWRPTTQEVYEAFASEGDGGISYLADHSWEAFERWLNNELNIAWHSGFYVASDGQFMPEDGESPYE